MVLRMIVVRMLKNRLQHCTKYRFLNLNTTFVHDMTVILNWILDLHEMILFNYCRIVLQEWLSFVDHVSKLLSHSSSYWWGEENSHPNLYPDSSKVTSFTRCKPDNFLKWSSDSNWTIPLNSAPPNRTRFSFLLEKHRIPLCEVFKAFWSTFQLFGTC